MNFKGSENHSIDIRNRITLPKNFLYSIESGFRDSVILTRGYDKNINIYPHNEWDKITNRLSVLNNFDDVNRFFIRNFLMWTYECNLNSRGTITIPKNLRDFAGIKDKIAILGVLDHIEVWDIENLNANLYNIEFPYDEIAKRVLAEHMHENSTREKNNLILIDDKLHITHTNKLFISSINEYLNILIRRNPEMVHKLSGREFEEYIAELFDRSGFNVELTKATVDGGVDIYAAKNGELGSLLYIVECKRYKPEKKVGVEVIQKLYGNVEALKATSGIVVTTSDFTLPAKRFQEILKYRLSLINYKKLKKWITLDKIEIS
jgi:division/cell wall cluster transcriptional repressor MraZ